MLWPYMLDMGQLLTSWLVVEEPNYFPKLFLRKQTE